MKGMFKSEAELQKEIDSKLDQYEQDANQLNYEEIQAIRDKIYADEKVNGFVYIIHLQLVLKEIETIHKKAVAKEIRPFATAYKKEIKNKCDTAKREIANEFQGCRRNLMSFSWTDPYAEFMIDTNATDRLGCIALLVKYDVDKYINPESMNMPDFWNSVQINYAIKKFMKNHKHNDILDKIYFADGYELWCKDICKQCIMLYKPSYGKSFFNFFLLVLKRTYYTLMKKYRIVSTSKHEATTKLPIFVEADHLEGGFHNNVEIEMSKKQTNTIDSINDKIDLQRFISTLTERQQQIVNLKLTYDLTQDEIASKLNVSTKTIKREFKTLKELYQKYFQ